MVVPAEFRRNLKIGRLVVISEEDGKVVVRPTMSLEDAFGVDGDGMREVAREISKERRRGFRPRCARVRVQAREF